MALNLLTEFIGRITGASPDYPGGSSKDETAPGAGDGTPYVLARANDLFGFMQALLRSSNITVSGNADTALVSQYIQSVVELAGGRANTYDETGAADVYVLDVRANQQGPQSYFQGMDASFFVGVTNTGASTVDINGLGVKDIKNKDGSALAAGALRAGEFLTIQYNGTYFIISSEGSVETVTNANGTAIKFPDGTLVCRFTTDVTGFILSTSTFYNWVFPVASVVNVTLGVATFRPVSDNILIFARFGASNRLTSANVAHDSLIGTGGSFELTAIGRWKV